MAKYRILLTKIERSEMDIVAINSFKAQEYAVTGTNKSNEKKQQLEYQTTILWEKE